MVDGAHLSTSTGLGSSDTVVPSQNAVKTYVDTNSGSWILIPAANYTTAPASTSTITMGVNMTASVLVGKTLRYTIGGVEYFGQVSSITSNLLTIRGAPLSGNVTNLKYGGGSITQLLLPVNGYYEDASDTLLLFNDNKATLFWQKEQSYAIYYRVWSRIHDSGTHGQVSVRINDVELNTTAGGLTVAASNFWYSTVVDIAVAAYAVTLQSSIEVTCVKGGNGDAVDLNVILVILTP
jgi:hypothetical protein